ncbi:MAG: fibronectin type III domain-containing protein [Armatimonadetes bacterium]|nr:fibronectin type III domain-containing protein [Armatimonadota bacterium]
MTHRKQLFVALLAVLSFAALSSRAQAQVSNWQKGVTLTAWWNNAYSSSAAMARLDQLKAMNVNYVTLIPTWFVSNSSSNTIYEDVNGASPSESSLRTCIQQIHARGMKVMLKPHVDSKDGTWRGALRPSSPGSWFSSYRSFMLKMATIAAQTGVAELCIGTELRSLSGSSYSGNWRPLAADIRKVYSGPLTYASNWDEYSRVDWWDALDHIGTDAYMPLTTVAYPSVQQIKDGWYAARDPWGGVQRWVDSLKALSVKYGKPILFTEIGYKDVASAANEWWGSVNTTQSYQSQINAYEAAFQVWEQQPWFIGFHWWDLRVQDGTYSRDHPINRKPVIDTITAWYGKSGGGTADTTPPSTPTGLTATPSGTSTVALKWNAATDNVGVAGYRLYRDGARIASLTGTSYTNSGLAASTTYAYRVSAVDAAGNESSQSAAVSATTAAPGDGTAPSVPTGLTATGLSSTQIALRWNASTDNTGVAGYRVYRNGAQIATANTTAHTDSGLAAGTTYSYQVAAVDAAGNTSALCAAVNGTTTAASDAAAYGFETGTEGWLPRARCTGVSADTSVKFAGNASLALQLGSVSNTSGTQAQAEVVPPSSLVGGKSVTAQVYLASTATNVRACLYTQDKNWRWNQGATITLKGNAWTEVAVTVPSGAAMPLNRLGVLLFTASGSFTGKACLDEVRWDGATVPPPPPPPTTSGAQYNFDDGTQGWANRARCTRVWAVTSKTYAGSGSIGLQLDGISYASGTQGQVEVQPLADLTAAKTVTAQVYLASTATNVRACLYTQDGTWRWTQGPTVTLKGGAWTALTIALPGDAVAPLNRLGVLLFTATGSFTGQVAVDEVGW